MKLGYRPALDGVRALAIAPVVTLHALGHPREGSVGVDIFFVLSGFLITALLLEERLSTGSISFRAFYRRRAARLFPALALLLAVYLIVTRGAHAWRLVFAATYTTNLAKIWAPQSIPAALTPLWSLAQEEQFYLWWPPLLLLVTRYRPGLLPRFIGLSIFAIALEKYALVAGGVAWTRIYVGPDTHADVLLIGCLFGAIFATGRAPRLPTFAGPLLLITLAVCLLLAEWHRAFLGAISPGRTLFAFGCGFLILTAADGGVVGHLLRARPLVVLGQISYSLYLWNWPIVFALGAQGRTARALLAICASICVAACSFYFVERPLRRRWRQRKGERILTPAIQPAS